MATYDQINGWLSANPTSTDADKRAAMDANGVSTADFAGATGFNLADVQQRYDAAAPKATPAPTAAPWSPAASYGVDGKNPTGLASVWTGGELNGGRANDVRNYITGRHPDAFNSSGAYDTSNNERNLWVAGGLKAMGIASDQGARMLGLDPAQVARFYADHGTDIEGSAGQFQADNPNLFIKPPPTMNLSAIQGPTAWNVQPNQTVANQLEQILKSDSPLMQLARTRAQQSMNARGLSNSTMAGTAGEAAMIDSAMPIATQDATTYANAGRFNADTSSTFSRDANAFGREQQMANFNVGANDWAAGRAFDRNQAGADAELGRQVQLLQAQITGNGTEADQKLQRDLTFLQAQQAANTGTATQAQKDTLQRGYVQSLTQARTDYATALANISSSSQMDAGLKAETLTNLKTTYNTIIGNYAKILGWDPSSWLIEAGPAVTPAPTAAPSNSGSSY